MHLACYRPEIRKVLNFFKDKNFYIRCDESKKIFIFLDSIHTGLMNNFAEILNDTVRFYINPFPVKKIDEVLMFNGEYDVSVNDIDRISEVTDLIMKKVDLWKKTVVEINEAHQNYLKNVGALYSRFISAKEILDEGTLISVKCAKNVEMLAEGA